MKNTHKLLAAGLLSCSMIGMTTTAMAQSASKVAEKAEVKTESVSLVLTGLKWASGCPPKVQAALLKVDGVSKAEVTKTSATVEVDRSKVTDEQLIKAVEGAGTGYGASVAAETESVSLVLTGLRWASGCPPRVQAALLKVDGVSKADVTKTSASVEVDRSKVTDEQLIAAVVAANKGYGATVAEEKKEEK